MSIWLIALGTIVGIAVAGGAVALSLHGLDDALKLPAPPAVNEQNNLTARAISDVREQLKDPSSAQFKDVLGSVDDNCVEGQVLAKNGFGGFDGYQGFVWQDKRIYFGRGPLDDPYWMKKTRCLDKQMARMEKELHAANGS